MVIIFGAHSVLLSATAGSEIDHILGSLSNQDYKGEKRLYLPQNNAHYTTTKSNFFMNTGRLIFLSHAVKIRVHLTNSPRLRKLGHF